MSEKRLIVIGAGAAGCMAAMLAAEQGMQVLLIDHMDRIGKKILVTGNGRCNMTNLAIRPELYVSSSDRKLEYLNQIFQFCDVGKLREIFRQRGLLTRCKDQLVYPMTMQASGVVDFFRNHLENRSNVTIRLQESVREIVREPNGRFRVRTEHSMEAADACIVACGGRSAPKTGSDGSMNQVIRSLGVRMAEQLPALVQCIAKGNEWKAMSGVRTDAVITLGVQDPSAKKGRIQYRERGELQITDYGISGIAVFQLSLFLAPYIGRQEVMGHIDFCPDLTLEEVTGYLLQQYKGFRFHPKITLADACSGLLQKKIMLQLMKQQGLKGDLTMHDCRAEDLKALAVKIKQFPVTVTGTKGFENAQVTTGGVCLEELTDSLEVKRIPGLFFAGEIVDVTGVCGGYNLHWAFASAYTAVMRGLPG